MRMHTMVMLSTLYSRQVGINWPHAMDSLWAVQCVSVV